MKLLLLLLILLFSTHSYSCQKLSGEIKINQLSFPIEQKCLKDQIYSFTKNSIFIHLKLNGKILDVEIDEIKSTTRDKILSTQLMFKKEDDLKFSVQSKEKEININLSLNQI